MLTPEQRARIARENGAKSKGPVTPEGKERSSRNALKSGEHAIKFRHLVPPHPAVLAHEDRAFFYEIFDNLLKTYRPSDPVSGHVVREIAYAQWEINRLNAQKTALWNSELVRQAGVLQDVAPELVQVEIANAATRVLYGRGGVLPRLNAEIHRLTRHISHLEKRIRFLNANFPSCQSDPQTSAEEREFFLMDDPPALVPEAEKRTNADPAQTIENVETEPGQMPLVTTENSPEVRAFYQFFFPGRELHIIQPDDAEQKTRKPAA